MVFSTSTRTSGFLNDLVNVPVDPDAATIGHIFDKRDKQKAEQLVHPKNTYTHTHTQVGTPLTFE